VRSRVTDAQIEAHAREIGVDKPLRKAMLENLRRFVQFVYMLSRLRVLELEGTLPGRSMLGYQSIVVLDGARWQALLDALCAKKRWFGSKPLVYENLLAFGFAQKSGSPKFKRPQPASVVLKNSSDKKIAAVMYSRRFCFKEKTLAGNVKRYTNGHVRGADKNVLNSIQCKAARVRLLDMLLDAAKSCV
jgi:hypothetical protein